MPRNPPKDPVRAAQRRARYHSDPENRARRLAQTRSAEANHEYMQKYYAENREAWAQRGRDPEVRERKNRARRERYANDVEFRERCKQKSRIPAATRRNNRLRLAFGISSTQFDELLSKQGGGCAICLTALADSRGHHLHVDHCHTTGAVRGLLCSNCNLGIGKFKDNPALLLRAASYLKESKNGQDPRPAD